MIDHHLAWRQAVRFGHEVFSPGNFLEAKMTATEKKDLANRIWNHKACGGANGRIKRGLADKARKLLPEFAQLRGKALVSAIWNMAYWS